MHKFEEEVIFLIFFLNMQSFVNAAKLRCVNVTVNTEYM